MLRESLRLVAAIHRVVRFDVLFLEQFGTSIFITSLSVISDTESVKGQKTRVFSSAPLCFCVKTDVILVFFSVYSTMLSLVLRLSNERQLTPMRTWNMATKKKVQNEPTVSLMPESETVARPRLTKLIIKNFRTIGTIPVEIDLDDVVVLVGANNTGKSSILRAYEVAMNNGSKAGRLTIDDFPNRQVLSESLPEVEVHTVVFHKPGQQWMKDIGNGEFLIRERWIWSNPDTEPKRQGFDVDNDAWSDSVPWGAPNVANAYRPKPHSIGAFTSPDEQADEIAKLLTDIIKDKLKVIKSGENQTDTDYDLLMKSIKDFQSRVAVASREETEKIEKGISEYLSKVFHNYVIEIDSRSEDSIEKTYSPFKENPTLKMGQSGGFLSTVATQGSGARRTLLWTALKYVSEREQESGERPHVLLLDEPEICLHPSAIRDARKVLYELPKTGNWQVMVTTHSPVFIDLSYDNTTIIRVDRGSNNEVRSTTLYRPKTASLSSDDKENLKLLNACDTYLHEFFFGGRIIIVEGDTEFTAFSFLKMLYHNEYKDVHIIRARGKGTIPAIIKILNQFTCDYAVLHDTDVPKLDNDNKNPAWTMNLSIKEEIDKNSKKDNVRLIACKTNFEDALFGQIAKRDKPYNAISKIRDDAPLKQLVKQLLDSLLDASIPPPDNCIKWDNIEQLQ